MIKIKIRVPIWATKSVGIAAHKIVDNLVIEILYEDMKGNRVYPGEYYISQSAARRYPIQTVKGIDLRIIPIKDLIPMGGKDEDTVSRQL